MGHCPQYAVNKICVSHAGVVFLCLFFCWGILYIRSHNRSTACKVGQSIWGALAAGAAALLIGQIILQIIYAAGNAGWATDAHTKRVLQLFGLTKASGAKQVILVRERCCIYMSIICRLGSCLASCAEFASSILFATKHRTTKLQTAMSNMSWYHHNSKASALTVLIKIQ